MVSNSSHILQDIQTLNERASRGELDISAISISRVCLCERQIRALDWRRQHGDGYGPILVANSVSAKEEVGRKRIAVPGTMTSVSSPSKLWLNKPRTRSIMLVTLDQIFQAVRPSWVPGYGDPLRPTSSLLRRCFATRNWAVAIPHAGAASQERVFVVT